MQFIFLSWSCGARHGWCFCRWNLVGIRVDTHLSWTDKMLRPLCHTLIQFSSPHSAPQHHSRPLMIYDAFTSSYYAVLCYFLDLESFQKLIDMLRKKRPRPRFPFSIRFAPCHGRCRSSVDLRPSFAGLSSALVAAAAGMRCFFPGRMLRGTLANRAMFVFLHLHMVCIVHRKSMNKWMKR